MSDSHTSRKMKEHETDESEDNSDIKVLASSVKKKKSGPANVAVKQRYKKDYHDTWPFLGPSTKRRLLCLLRAAQEGFFLLDFSWL